MTILVVLIVKAHLGTIWPPNTGVDVEIPLRAVERWQGGEEPYLAEAFTSGPGATQPFLYPPYVLPLFAALVDLPRDLVRVGAAFVLLLVTIATCRRLAIPWVWMPLVLAWPPFAEGILDGNVSMLIFAAFVFLFYRAGGEPWRPAPRDIAAATERPSDRAWSADSRRSLGRSKCRSHISPSRARRVVNAGRRYRGRSDELLNMLSIFTHQTEYPVNRLSSLRVGGPQ